MAPCGSFRLSCLAVLCVHSVHFVVGLRCCFCLSTSFLFCHSCLFRQCLLALLNTCQCQLFSVLLFYCFVILLCCQCQSFHLFSVLLVSTVLSFHGVVLSLIFFTVLLTVFFGQLSVHCVVSVSAPLVQCVLSVSVSYFDLVFCHFIFLLCCQC